MSGGLSSKSPPGLHSQSLEPAPDSSNGSDEGSDSTGTLSSGEGGVAASASISPMASLADALVTVDQAEDHTIDARELSRIGRGTPWLESVLATATSKGEDGTRCVHKSALMQVLAASGEVPTADSLPPSECSRRTLEVSAQMLRSDGPWLSALQYSRVLREYFPTDGAMQEGIAELWAGAEHSEGLAEALMALLPHKEPEFGEAISRLSAAADYVHTRVQPEGQEEHDGMARALYACLDQDGSGSISESAWSSTGLSEILKVSRFE